MPDTELTANLLKLVNIRGHIKARLTKMINFITDNAPTLFDINVRIPKLELIYSDYMTVHQQIMSATEFNEKYDECDSFEELYYKTKALMDEKLHEPIQQVRNAMTSSSNEVKPLNKLPIKLPEIKLPTFDGTFNQWIPFRDQFDPVINKQEHLSGVHKFHYLLGTVTGEARKLIDKIELSSAGYNLAWQTLHDRYDNKRVIVERHISELLHLKPMTSDSASEIRNLVDQCQNNLRALSSLDQQVQHWDIIIVSIISSRLETETRKQWELSIPNKESPTWDNMVEFLLNRARILESIEINKLSGAIPKSTTNYHAKNQSSASHSKNFVINNQKLSKQNSCSFCNSSKHFSTQCHEFLTLSSGQRYSKVKQLKLCENCLRKNHEQSECKSRACKLCNQNHNTLLHVYYGNSSQPSEKTVCNESNKEPNVTKNSTSLVCATIDPQVLLSTAIVLLRDASGEYRECRVFLDSCAQSNFMTYECADKLRLKKYHQTVHEVSGINDMKTSFKFEVTTTVKSRFNNYSAEFLQFIVVPSITKIYPATSINTSNWSIPNNISLADPCFNKPTRIDALIGGEIFLDCLRDGSIKLFENSRVTFQNTAFGYIIGGKTMSTQNLLLHSSLADSTQTEEISNFALNEQLKRFFELEAVNIAKVTSPEETACEKHFVENFMRQDNGRYSVRLPFRENINQLGESKTMSVRRFAYIEAKLERDPQLREHYNQFIDEYIALGHMQLVDDPVDMRSAIENDHMSDETSVTHYYIPHHCILKPSSTTTKLRVVYDASAKSNSGTALNDTLMVGPCIQDELFSIVLRFRRHEYAFTADIEKMYRQVIVDPRDRNYQLILWRSHPSHTLKTYQLNTLTYGTATAPFLATRVLKQLSIDESKNYPLASEAIKDFYVDDVMTGAKTLADAIKLQDELIQMMKRGGMNLRKFSSNCPQLLDRIPSDDREQNATHEATINAIKTLGLLWDSSTDTLRYNVQQAPELNVYTKRIALSQISQIFDPLGLVAPIIIKAKIFIQQLWLSKLDWDEPLSDEQAEFWRYYYNQINSIEATQLNRCVIPSNAIAIELHGFADASELAYGAVIYIRCITDTSEITVHLLCAKSKVAQLKKITIPRLELCAAHLLSRLVTKVYESMHIKFDKTVLYSDSTIVLAWLKTHPAQLQTFIANRVSEIQDLDSSITWTHVDTLLNPADLVSRGVMPSQLKPIDMWWHGPPFLRQASEILLTTLCDHPAVKSPDVIEQHSSFSRLIRVFAYCARFINHVKRRRTAASTTLSADDIHKGTIYLLRYVQFKSFHTEIESLRRDKTVKNSSKLKNLTPFLDADGLIRVGGRIKNCNLSFDQKHQIILPNNNHLTRLVFHHEHIKNLHCGALSLLNHVRFKFWPISGKQQAKLTVRGCIVCFKTKPVTVSQIMGDLPHDRVTPHRAFSIVGVDYCGPVSTKTSGSRHISTNKTYIAIFICFSTKAMHIEVVSDLSTPSFIAALKRFISRRGKPSIMHSDNGTNFVGAFNEITRIRDFFSLKKNQGDIKQFLASEEIDWRFIPPRAPHFGGLWEAGVKSVKHHFRRVSQNQILTFEELTTVCTEIEACLNSRPLSPLSDDPTDLSPLTPGHFLIGKPITSLPERQVADININRVRRWQKVTQMTQSFWNRWSREYLNTLQQRTKWTKASKNIKINDLALIHHDNLPTTKWRLGRVIKLYHGDDGIVRVVSLKTANGIITRAIRKICPLPLANELSTLEDTVTNFSLNS